MRRRRHQNQPILVMGIYQRSDSYEIAAAKTLSGAFHSAALPESLLLFWNVSYIDEIRNTCIVAASALVSE